MTEQPTPERTPSHTQPVHRDSTTISEYLESLLVTVILALFGTTFVVQAFKIPSPSMEKTLLVGDHLLVNKFVFGGTGAWRSEEHTSELQSHSFISYAVFCLKKIK